ncbi:hypothetical protein BG841_15160 [Marinobacter sp. X15-166B]|nr:DUF1365 domain-containing protein [Marinobacter sp. X15-166B]OEY68101.1 hypothetical protein BG841_15160 [Marinobacter sp. X15-166B]
MHSQWLTGRIRHRRMAPGSHAFSYGTGMLALDLDEWTCISRVSRLFSVGRFNWLSLNRDDYLDPSVPDLKNAVKQRVARATGWRPDGPVELITHPRYLGYVFNPVSFYFCYAHGASPQQGHCPRVILAQVTNTPWQQRHVYCLECPPVAVTSSGWRTQRFGFTKRFHVSPFNPMQQHYQWLFSFRGNELRIHINVLEAARKIFDATLVVQRTPLTRTVFHKNLRQFPLESLKVVAGIYWQALRLKLKGVRFHSHPDKLAPDADEFRLGSDDEGVPVSSPHPKTQPNGRVTSWRI